MKKLFSTLFVSLFAFNAYAADRIYTGNQISNTVSVIDAASNTLLGEIVLGKPYPNSLTPLYKGASLVHGLGYDKNKKLLAVVAVGSNSVSFVSTQDNKVLKTLYVGRSPHEPTFTPDGKQVWVAVRGEAYISVIDTNKMEEIKKIPVTDGPGMVSFSKDGKFAYICSSFTPEVNVVNTKTYQVVKKIPVISPFSPNIYTSPDGQFVALSHKDVGKISVIDTSKNEVVKILDTGQLTNHVTFIKSDGRLLMAVTVGGENAVKLYDVAKDYQQIASIPVGVLPHGLWASPDGNVLYVGLEYADSVQPVDLKTMTALKPIQIGQSPQALVYAQDAAPVADDASNLSPLQNKEATEVIKLTATDSSNNATGQISIRNSGQTQLIEQQFFKLKPNTVYTLAFSDSKTGPKADYKVNAFQTDANGKYAGQSTGLVKNTDKPYSDVVLIEEGNKQIILISK